jgi:formate transporter
MTDQISYDALLPPGMAAKAEDLGVKKANLKTLNMFFLAVLAGALISIGAIFAMTVAAATSTLLYGVARLLIGLAFTHGLILVVVGGAELFTGNTLITMTFARGKVSLSHLLWNLIIVSIDN